MRQTLLYALTGVFLSAAALQGAAVVIASGAGFLPATAQDLTGIYVGEIQGSLSGDDPNDVDVFALNILNPFAFSAITVNSGAHGIPDTELFLFDSLGFGVYFNDDISGSNTLSCLPSAGAFNPCPTASAGLGPLLPGEYFLAITRSFNSPLDLLQREIFSAILSTDVTGPNPGVSAIAGWDNFGNASPNTDAVSYDILITGTVPEPATWVLLFGAITGLAGLRCAQRHRKV